MKRLIPFAFALVAALALPSVASAHEHAGDRTVLFSSESLGPNDVVKGDLNIVMGSVSCDGGTVDGDVNVVGGSFDGGNCNVGGTVNDVSVGHLFSAPALGAIPWMIPHRRLGLVEAENRHLFVHLGYSAIVLVIFLLFPLRVRMALDRVEHVPVLAATVGTLALIAVVPVAVLLAISIVGIPLIVLEIAALFGGIWIGQGAIAILLGRRLLELARPHATPAPLGALFLGLVVVSAAESLPVFGAVVTAIIWVLGLGATLLTFSGEGSFRGLVTKRDIGGTPMKTS